jgi:hypothetical protein
MPGRLGVKIGRGQNRAFFLCLKLAHFLFGKESAILKSMIEGKSTEQATQHEQEWSVEGIKARLKELGFAEISTQADYSKYPAESWFYWLVTKERPILDDRLFQEKGKDRTKAVLPKKWDKRKSRNLAESS